MSKSGDTQQPIEKSSKIGLAVGLSIGTAVIVVTILWFICMGPLLRRRKRSRERHGIVTEVENVELENGHTHDRAESDVTKVTDTSGGHGVKP